MELGNLGTFKIFFKLLKANNSFDTTIWQKATTTNMYNMDLRFVLKEYKELITVNKNYTQNVINISSIKAVENKILVQLISKYYQSRFQFLSWPITVLFQLLINKSI